MTFAIALIGVVLVALTFAISILISKTRTNTWAPGNTAELVTHLVVLESATDKVNTSVREEARVSREELRTVLSSHDASQESRSTNLQSILDQRLSLFSERQLQSLSSLRLEIMESQKGVGDTLRQSTDSFAQTLTIRLNDANFAIRDLAERLERQQVEGSKSQRDALDEVTVQVQALLESNEKRQDAVGEALSVGLERLHKDNEGKLEQMRISQKEGLDLVTNQIQALLESNEKRQDALRDALSIGLETLRRDNETKLDQMRASQKDGLDLVTKQIQALLESNEKRQDALQETLNTNLEQLRKDNEAKLEQMRVTVDEKLQGTLEKRLGESFQIVSDGLSKVHQGLGEMQNLATGVGDLKRVLTNVKSRGGWAEMQLGTLLEDMLSRDQYVKNARIKLGGSEVVEYAVKLPGQTDSGACLLPIDAKFPNEDYERLLQAQDRGSPSDIEECAAAIERSIKTEAERISEKYICPPDTTSFAIMYLPTEGLFAEVIRRPGLVAHIQQKYRVTITGPTTLSACLSSLQMGFITLAIQKRSSEVWQVLSAAKAEFHKYGEVWEKLGKQLDTAKRTVDEAGRRTRAVERQLRTVETIDVGASNPHNLIAFKGCLADGDEPDEGEAA